MKLAGLKQLPGTHRSLLVNSFRGVGTNVPRGWYGRALFSLALLRRVLQIHLAKGEGNRLGRRIVAARGTAPLNALDKYLGEIVVEVFQRVPACFPQHHVGLGKMLAFAAVQKQRRRGGVRLLHDVEGGNAHLSSARAARSRTDIHRIARAPGKTMNLEGVVLGESRVRGFPLRLRRPALQPHKCVVCHLLLLQYSIICLLRSFTCGSQRHGVQHAISRRAGAQLRQNSAINRPVAADPPPTAWKQSALPIGSEASRTPRRDKLRACPQLPPRPLALPPGGVWLSWPPTRWPSRSHIRKSTGSDTPRILRASCSCRSCPASWP